jgi:hypothetical protein
MAISFEITQEDQDAISAIVERAEEFALKYGDIDSRVKRIELTVDITACHANCCKLNLEQLLKARDTDFVHDVFGIRRYIDRQTGHLGCFLPRFAL